MLVDKAKTRNSFGSYNRTSLAMEESLPRRKKKQRTQTSDYAKIMVLGLIVFGVIVSMVIGYVSVQAKMASYTYNIDKMQKKEAKLVSMNEQLKLKASELQSLPKIEQVAKTKLGMVEPKQAKLFAGKPGHAGIVALVP